MNSENRDPSAKGGLMAWLEERVDLSALRQLIAKKTVPMHRHSIWYYFGGMALFLFMVQVFTGVLLLLYLRGGEDVTGATLTRLFGFHVAFLPLVATVFLANVCGQCHPINNELVNKSRPHEVICRRVSGRSSAP